MKAKKLLALALTLCLAFSCIAVIPFTATVASADEPTATAGTSAVWIGPSSKSAKAISMVFLPITWDMIGGASDGVGATMSFDYKSSDGTRPVVGVWRTVSKGDNANTNLNGYTGTLTSKYDWVSNGSATKTGNRLSVGISFNNIPGAGSLYYKEKREKVNGTDTQIRYRGGMADADGIAAVVTIGNGALGGDGNECKDANFSSEYIISNPTLTINGKTFETPSFASCNKKAVYNVLGRYKDGDGTDSSNHPLRAPRHTWSKWTTDPDTVKFVTIDNDYLTANRTYVEHAETANTIRYYTCADFGDNVKFEKFGSLAYSKIGNDTNKKAIVIGNDGTDKVANIFIPLYTHQYFSSIDSDNKLVKEDNSDFKVKVTFNAKRLSGEGQPMLGYFYPDGWNSEGCPVASTGRAYNNGDGEGAGDKDWITSSYNASTGEFEGWLEFESGYYRQTGAWNGANHFVTIGNCEHKSDSFDATNFGASFIISDIKIALYGMNCSDTLVAENIAPEMIDSNCYFNSAKNEIDDHKSQFIFTKNYDTSWNGRNTGFNFAPLNTYCADGAQQQIFAINRNACNAAAHTLTKHAATATTREYYSCETCQKNFVDKYASEECDTIYVTNKMIAIKASGSRPGNAFITINNPGAEGVHYYKFTCDMRIFGDELPVISTVKGSWWGGNGAQSENGWVNADSEPNKEGLYTYYDEETHKYTAIFKVEHENANLPWNYFNSISGAYAALILGNGRHVGANGYENETYFTSFIFSNPEIYELEDVRDENSTIGENICPPITDKTLNFNTSYSGETANYYNTENTMYRSNNILSAPVGKWNIDGSMTWVKEMDIPANTFFTEQQGFDAKMFRLGGAGNNYNGISTQLFLKANTTYQFDIDYRNFGSPERIYIQAADGDGYHAIGDIVTVTPTADNVAGAHKSFRFTMPSNARNNGDGNFRIYLGQQSAVDTTRNTTTVYYGNVKVRSVDGDGNATGSNLFMNGAFDFGGVGDITAQNQAVKLFGWQNEASLSYAKHDLMKIPAGFFEGDIGESGYAVKFNAKDWSYIRTAVDLEPSSVYELSYNYSGTDDDINFSIDAMGTRMSLEKVADHSATKFTKTYRITTSSDLTYYSGGDSNTVLEFRCPASADGNEFYINNIQLHKVENNALVGTNMLGDRNAIYDASVYPSASNDFTLGTSRQSSTINSLGHGWWGTKDNTTGAVVAVGEHFFDYYAPADRMALLTNVLLNKGTGYNPYAQDDGNQYYNPDGLAGTNILDLVRLKKDIVNINDAGGAGAEASILLDKINSAADVADSGTVRKVAKGGNLATALNNASSGTKVLLERGGEWRIPSGESGFTVKQGVTLGAYGTGAKPVINGSQKNYATATWTQDGTNIWKTRITSSASTDNVPGTVYFFNSASGTTPDLIGRIIVDGARFANKDAMTQQGDVYYAPRPADGYDGYIYVYSTTNPASKYGKIEIGERRTVLTLNTGATVDNIAVKYAGGHGIYSIDKNNITITNCEVAYIGGTPNGTETMGNGMQFSQSGSNITVNNCYVHDCYDAGLTFQTYSNDDGTFNGVYFTNNLLTNNFYNIEFFTTGTPENKSGEGTVNGTMKNIEIKGNIMRFAGECWSYAQRMGDERRCANICVTQNAYYVNTSNLVIESNIFDCTMVQQILWTWGDLENHKSKTSHVGVTITGNTYYQKAGSLDGCVNRFGNVTSTKYEYAGSTASLAAAIAKMDSAPKKVEWVNRATKF